MSLINETLARADSSTHRLQQMLDKYARDDEAREQARLVERDREAAERTRRHNERKREYQTIYNDSFVAFGSEAPMPHEDETSLEFRCRLFDRLRRRLPPDHELADVRADDCVGSRTLFENFERALIKLFSRQRRVGQGDREDRTLILNDRSGSI